MQTSSLFIILSTFLEYRDLVTAKDTGRSSSGGGAFTGHGLGAAAIGHNGVTNEQRANQADREANIQKTNPDPASFSSPINTTSQRSIIGAGPRRHTKHASIYIQFYKYFETAYDSVKSRLPVNVRQTTCPFAEGDVKSRQHPTLSETK